MGSSAYPMNSCLGSAASRSGSVTLVAAEATEMKRSNTAAAAGIARFAIGSPLDSLRPSLPGKQN